MGQDQAVLVAILLATVTAFLWGRWRHDMVALGALLACVAAGLVPGADAFLGFGHPAVITVACVLILSYGLQTSGAVDLIAKRTLPEQAGPWLSVAALALLAAVLSAFMNNVGALALLMPVAVQMARKRDLAPGQVLMPLAFGSILGGMTTLIGTPPNLIVSGFRAEAGLGTFTMFDYAPVGVVVALAGLAFVLLAGRWLIPVRERGGADGFDTGHYLTEVRVPDESKSVGLTLREIEAALEEMDAQVVSLVRDEMRVPAPSPARKVRAGDILVVEAEPRELAAALNSLGLRLEEDKQAETSDGDEEDDDKGGAATDAAPGELAAGAPDPASSDAGEGAGDRGSTAGTEDGADQDRTGHDGDGDRDDGDSAGKKRESRLESDEIVLMELAVLPDSSLVGRSASDLMLRTRYGINLLAVSRQGQRSMARLRSITLRASDVLLLQGATETLQEFALNTGCVPLADRALRLPRPREAAIAGAIMVGAVSAAVFGLVPAAIAFAAGVLAAMATRVVPPRKVYEAVDWPVIVLLGALIPVAGAMATTGTADLIATALLDHVARGSPVIALVVLLVVTMTLSDFMNNAATAAVMCPIAISAAATLGVSPDPMLMAVAVGASCAFLTPIGHQNNTLILGPGGFRFGDYWRLGLPLEVIVIAVGVPMILLVWPL